jgi:2-C-methyl-D-erythritol 4-phosphate cytidylyltransferase
VHSALTLLAAGCSQLVVVVPPAYRSDASDVVDRELDQARVTVVTGGETRQESVRKGLEVIDSDMVVIHDAARPFVTTALIRRVIEGVAAADGCVAGLPVNETIKRVQEGRVIETVDRSELWRVQTPQAFKTASLRSAHEAASDMSATDDAQLVERDGGTIVMVRGEPANMKLTYEDDLAIAESLMAAR